MKNGIPIKLSIMPHWLPALTFLILLLAATDQAALAQTGGDYSLTWSTVDGGGEVLADGGAYQLLSTTGQPEAEVSAASGGDYTVMSGFWSGMRAIRYLYLPLLLRDFAVAPDLTIDSVTATTNGATVTIRNAGNSAVTDAFWVDVYFNPTQTPEVNLPWEIIAPAGAVWGVTEPLAPGESLTLISGGEFYFTEYSSPLPFPEGARVYAYVDSVNPATDYGAIHESNEGNNLREQIELTAVGEPSFLEVAPPPVREGLPER